MFICKHSSALYIEVNIEPVFDRLFLFDDIKSLYFVLGKKYCIFASISLDASVSRSDSYSTELYPVDMSGYLSLVLIVLSSALKT